MSTVEQCAIVSGDRWLMLVSQFPAKPAYLRVKIWRRLQALGAVSVKNSVYVLPAFAEAQEDFEWLLREIREGGGEAMLCEARLVDGLTDREVRALFDRARDADYEQIAKEARALAKELRRRRSPAACSDAKTRLAKLEERHARLHAIDFFGAGGREASEGLLNGIATRLRELESSPAQSRPISPETDGFDKLKQQTWVTRTGVHVDRIGSAWLIRRFIDPQARFKFVPAKGYRPQSGEWRFDMFEAEFTHEGDRCTFEVLVVRAGLGKDRALATIAEIVHDIDLKDGKFGRPEVEGIKALIAGVCRATDDDGERLARGAELFDDLHRSFLDKRTKSRSSSHGTA